jgi:alpha-tubulin suppressor-like RCC1 family protein
MFGSVNLVRLRLEVIALSLVIVSFATPGVGIAAAAPVVHQSVTSGWFHSCAVRADRSLWCWGENWAGQLGDGSMSASNVPVQVGSATDWISVAAGDTHTCALNDSGEIWCWGMNHYGQLGTGSSVDGSSDYSAHPTPTRVVGSFVWDSLNGGDNHYCATTQGGQLYCWGANGDPEGRLGTGGTELRNPTPLKVGDGWATVDAGDYHTCAIEMSGRLFCWGKALGDGRLGTGIAESSLTPLRVGLADDWVSVSAGYFSSCAINASGALFCWGANQSGQLGDGTTANQLAPVPIGVDKQWRSVDVDNNYASMHTCAISVEGALYCWGANGSGQLGTGGTLGSLTPTQVGTETDWKTVSTGANHTCAVKVDLSIYCWGSNRSGELGDGTTTDRLAPTLVMAGSNDISEDQPTIELDVANTIVNYADPQTLIATARDALGNPVADYTLQLQASIPDAAKKCAGATATNRTDAEGRAVFIICPIKSSNWSASDGKTSESPEIAISVRLVPTAPRTLTGFIAKKVLTLAWAAPSSANASPIADYIIQVRSLGSATWTTVNDGVSKRLNAAVKRLAAGVTYEFRVAGKNRSGVGEWSQTLQLVLN